VQLIGETGSVATELPATFDVKSMTGAANAASQPGNVAMCIGSNCLPNDLKHVTIICTFDTAQRVSCWLGPALPPKP
jgi:hypothetical protein